MGNYPQGYSHSRVCMPMRCVFGWGLVLIYCAGTYFRLITFLLAWKWKNSVCQWWSAECVMASRACCCRVHAACTHSECCIPIQSHVLLNNTGQSFLYIYSWERCFRKDCVCACSRRVCGQCDDINRITAVYIIYKYLKVKAQVCQWCFRLVSLPMKCVSCMWSCVCMSVYHSLWLSVCGLAPSVCWSWTLKSAQLPVKFPSVDILDFG